MRLDIRRIDFRKIDIRRLARVISVFAVAMAAGHLVQTVAARKDDVQRQTMAAAAQKPVGVVQLVGTNEPIAEPVAPKTPLPKAALAVAPPAPKVADVPKPAPQPVPAVLRTPVPSKTEEVVAKAAPCATTLDLMAEPGGLIGLTLLAPCHPNARVVLRHAGLAVTGKTTANGSLFLSLPALETVATVEAVFGDGTRAKGSLSVPELDEMRRFGVQWQGYDAFQVYGFVGDKAVSAVNPGLVSTGLTGFTGGFVTSVGDPTAANPLLAEIYTYPADGTAKVVIEAAVTYATCNRDLLGETIASDGGVVKITELTLAMPACDAAGDFLVLNNLAPDLTVTAAN